MSKKSHRAGGGILEGYACSSGWLYNQQTVSARNRGCSLPWAAEEKGWKRGSPAGRASCADHWHSDFRFSDRKQRLSQSRRLTAMRLRFSSDIKWFNTWLCKTPSERVSLCLQPSRNPLWNYLKYWHPLWAFIPSPSGCSWPRLFPRCTLHLEHTCTGSCVRDGAAHLPRTGAHCWGTHTFQCTQISPVKFLFQDDFVIFI